MVGMEVHSLRLHVTDADLSELAKRHMPDDSPLEEVAFRLTPEGLCVEGAVPLLVTVRFESWWDVAVEGGKIRSRLARLKAMGMPAAVLKSAVMKAIQSATESAYGIVVDGDVVIIDPDFLLARYAVAGRTNLQAVRLSAGFAVVEGGVDG